MAKDYIGEYSTTAGDNTDVGGVDIDEGCAPGGINNAIREVMSHLAQIGQVSAKSANYTVIDDDDMGLITVDASVAARTINLTAAATLGSGFWCIVQKIDSSANAVTIDPNGAETVNGASTYVLTAQYESALVWCDGSNFLVPGGSGKGIFATNSNGNPNISDTFLDVEALTEDSWEEIGTVEWPALSSVPAGASWIEVKLLLDTGSIADSEFKVYVRKAGAGDDSVGNDNLVAEVYTTSTRDVPIVGIKIPISSDRKFDVYWAGSNILLGAIEMYLTGYGYN